MTGGRHGIDDDGRLLALKLVHGADASAGKSLLQLEHLRIVWSYDEDIFERNRRLIALSVDPGRVGSQDVRNEVADRIGFFRGRTLISVVRDRKVPKARTVKSGIDPDFLPLKSWPRLQATFVKQLRIEGTDERMEPSRFGEEQTPIGRNRGMGAEDMIQG